MNFFAYQYPWDGEEPHVLALHHLASGQADYREWLMAPLLEPLEVGKNLSCCLSCELGMWGQSLVSAMAVVQQ